MKRSELKEGQELYYAKPYEWSRNIQGERVKVVTTASVRRSRSVGGVFSEIIPAAPGSGVHVRFLRSDGGPEREDVVLVQHLRGPYAKVKAQVDAKRQAGRDAQRQIDDQRKNDIRAAAAAALRAVAEGASSAHRDFTLGTYVTMSADDLAGLLDRLNDRDDR